MADATVYCGMLVNSLSGVGIIILNKYIVSEDAFNYVVFLSFCHFLFTASATRMNCRPPKYTTYNSFFGMNIYAL